MQGESAVDDPSELSSPQGLKREHKPDALTIKIKPMLPPSNHSSGLGRQTRSAAARSASAQQHTGSEYTGSANSNSGSLSDEDHGDSVRKSNARSSRGKDADGHAKKQGSAEYQTRGGRVTKGVQYTESTDGDDDTGPITRGNHRRTRSSKKAKKKRVDDSDMEAGDDQVALSEAEAQDDHPAVEDDIHIQSTSKRSSRKRLTKRDSEQDTYIDEPDAEGSTETDEAFDDPAETSSEPLQDETPEENGRRYTLRQRQKVDYAIPPPIEEMKLPPKLGPKRGRGRLGPGWSANGTELSRYINLPAEDSVRFVVLFQYPIIIKFYLKDSDYATRTPRKGLGTGINGGLFAAGSGMFPTDLAAAAGTPSNLGKITDSSAYFRRHCSTLFHDYLAVLADADPLGVNQNVTFDEVGGLDDRQFFFPFF